MTDQDVRDLLERMAAEEPIPFFDAEPLTRRARHRAARTVVVGAVGVAAAIAVLFAGVAEIRTAPSSRRIGRRRPRCVGRPHVRPRRRHLRRRSGPDERGQDRRRHGRRRVRGSQRVLEPSWSPDGKYLAFEHDCTSPERRDVVITDPLGNASPRARAMDGDSRGRLTRRASRCGRSRPVDDRRLRRRR